SRSPAVRQAVRKGRLTARRGPFRALVPSKVAWYSGESAPPVTLPATAATPLYDRVRELLPPL
ncbi:MAG: hypothetical protein VX956_13870, partial [Gemmatimonadota bacterium]|nr:hypothetical protein [Gemmatimonadota bacterium]